jgi:membrane AbrB-like protein
MFGSAIDMRLLPPAETLALLGVIVVAYFFFTVGLGSLYFRAAGLDRTSSFFASIPGNFSEVIIVAEVAGADIRSVALMHAARLVIAIPTVSFVLQWIMGVELSRMIPSQSSALGIADMAVLTACGTVGYALALLIRMPAPQMFGPLILSMVAHTYGIVDGAPPPWAVAAAQVLLGTFAGARFAGVAIREIKGLFLVSLVWAALLLLIVSVFAAAIHRMVDQPAVAVFLAFSPGGFAEISMIAIAAGMGLGFISTAHFIRTVTVILLIPLIVKVWQR